MPPDDPEKGGGGRPGTPAGAGGEVIFEFQPMGGSVKVSAIDPETNTEVSIVGAAAATEAELKRVAVRKFEYVLAKNLRVRT